MTPPCRWEVGEWQPCSTSCGQGQQVRSVHCWRLLGRGFDSSVLNKMCRHLPKPPEVRSCIATDCGPVWLVSEWSNVGVNRQADTHAYRRTHSSRTDTYTNTDMQQRHRERERERGEHKTNIDSKTTRQSDRVTNSIT